MDIFYSTQLDILTDIPLTPSLNHQLYFATQAERDAYFNTHVRLSWQDFKFLREEGIIKVQGIELDYYNINYIRFKNGGTGGMWIYAFVLTTQYVNRNTTALNIKVDAWQTYFNQLEIRECDITRTHVDSSNWRNYTLTEGLDIGDYKLQYETDAVKTFNLNGVLIISTIDLITSGGTIDNPIINSATGGQYNGAPSACSLYYTTFDNLEILFTALSEYPWVANGIIGVYGISSEMINGDITYINSKMGFRIGYISSSDMAKSFEEEVSLSAFLPTVKNTKLWTYPYTYIDVAALDGSKITLKPELFDDNTIKVTYICSLLPQPTIYVKINNYMNVKPYIDYISTSLTFNGFPSYPCLNDQYLLAKEQAKSMENLIARQNMEQIQVNTLGGFGSILGGGLSGGVGGAATATVEAVGSLTQSVKAEQDRAEVARLSNNQIVTAPQLCGSSSSATCSVVLNYRPDISFLFRSYTLIPSMLERIDKYFTVYGYKVNQITTPNLAGGNRRYKYIKCNHVNMFGNIPQVYLEEIRVMFLQGVTLWFDSNVGVY